MTIRENAAQDLERIGIMLCTKNPGVEPVSLTLNDVRRHVMALGQIGGIDLDERTLEAIRFAWGAEFLDRTK